MFGAVRSHPLFVLSLIGWLVWGWTLTFDFVWDDFPMIVENSSLERWRTLYDGWFHDFWMLHDRPLTSGYWRPLPTMMHVLMVKLLGKQPWAFHALNVALHCGTAWFFYRFLSTFTQIRFLWIGVLFFLIHPIHAEAVSFNSALPDLLSAFFGWAAIAYWFSVETPSRIKKIVFTSALILMASFSKESGVFYGVFLVFCEWYLALGQSKNRFFGVSFAIGLTGLFYVIAHLAATRGLGTKDFWGETLGHHLATVMKLFGYQLFLLFVPIGSSPSRDFEVVRSFSDPGFWIGFAVFALILVWGWQSLKRRSIWFFVIVFYLIFWFPISNVIPAEGLITNRYLYLPSFAVAMAICLLCNHMKRPILYLPLLMGWGGFAVFESLPFKNNESLWQNAIKRSPRSPVAWNEWGNILLQKKEHKKALEAFEQALLFRENYQDASGNKGLVYFEMGRRELSKEWMKKHIARFPNDAHALDLLATIAIGNGNRAESLQFSQKAVNLEPKNWKYRFNLAQTYLESRKYDQASAELESVLATKPEEPGVWKSLAFAQCQDGQFESCLSTYRQIAVKFPSLASEAKAQIEKTERILQVLKGT